MSSMEQPNRGSTNSVIYDEGVIYRRTNRRKVKNPIKTYEFMSPETPPQQAQRSFFPVDITPPRPASFINRFNEHIPQYQNDLYSQRAYSEFSTESSAKSSVQPTAQLPPSSIPATEYYKLLPHNLTKTQKMKQLIVWIASNPDITRTPHDHSNTEAQRAHLIAQELKRKFIEELMVGQVDVSWWTRPYNEPFQGQRNPTNLANEEKLQKLEKSIQLFKDELQDWSSCANKVYQLHAEAKDAVEPEPTLEYDDIDTEDLAEKLDDTQREFLKQYCVKHPRSEPNNSLVMKLEGDVAYLRQQLKSCQLYVDATSKDTRMRMAKLAVDLHDKRRLVPIEQDCDKFDVSTVEEKMASEKRAFEDMLRVWMKKSKDQSL